MKTFSVVFIHAIIVIFTMGCKKQVDNTTQHNPPLDPPSNK